MKSYIDRYLGEVKKSLDGLDREAIECLVKRLVGVRDRHGRLFMLGVGGNAADCTHAVADFRKLCGIEAYAATDNISEVTARTNDDGWSHTFADYLRGCHLTQHDLVFVLSVGGGGLEASPNIAAAVRLAAWIGADIVGIVGPDGGATAASADVCVKVPASDPLVTPLTHSLQMVLLHALFIHPQLALPPTVRLP